jgi:hypothetical protein
MSSVKRSRSSTKRSKAQRRPHSPAAGRNRRNSIAIKRVSKAHPRMGMAKRMKEAQKIAKSLKKKAKKQSKKRSTAGKKRSSKKR